ncbi:MAG: hypothetical protein JW806_00555 [Sedimentisphaerales bacterium]|nr:hypothetical protein [Sedimentisphaerales bacterium]
MLRDKYFKIKRSFPAVFVIFCLVNILYAGIGIKPAYVELELDKGQAAGKFIISNLGEEEERFRVNAIHFTYSIDGGLSQMPTGPNSLATWIHFNPKELVMPPNSQRAVRFAIVPRGELKQGSEYWAAMELESLRTSETTSTDEESGKSVKLRVVSTIMVPMFGTVGDVVYEGNIEDVNIVTRSDGVFIHSIVNNTGAGRIGAKGEYIITDALGQVVYEGKIGKGYVLGGTKRRFLHKIADELPEGKYNVKVTYSALHFNEPLTSEIEIDWKPQQTEVASDNASSSLTDKSRHLAKK